MTSIVQKDIIYNMVNEVEQNTLSNDIEVKYTRPRFFHRVLANLVDFIIFAVCFVGLFVLTRYVVAQTPHFSATFNQITSMRLESGMYYKNKNGDVVDIVSYMDSSTVMTNEAKVKFSENRIEEFLTFEKKHLSEGQYNKIVDQYNEKRLAKTYKDDFGTVYHLFVLDGEGNVVKNDELFVNYKGPYKNFYRNYIDNYFQGYLASTPIYYDAMKIISYYLIFLEIPVAYILSIILVYYVPTLFFKRGRRTLGKALYRIGTVDSRFLSPTFARNTAKWALFILEMLLGVVSIGIIFILSFTMMAFSKNKQGFPDYMLGLQEIDISNNKIFYTYEEIELNNVERHKKPRDFRLIERP